MKVFFIDSCDYVAANSETEAIDFYSNETGISVDEFELEEIPSEMWEETLFMMEDGDGTPVTLLELLNNVGNEPEIVASIEP